MVGKMLLPSLGGPPAVWNTCVVFFQLLLLFGYGYAHFGSSRLKPRTQIAVHFVLLGLVALFLPIGLIKWLPINETWSPVSWLLVQLALMVGIPFFVLSSNAPLIQRWYGYVCQKDEGGDPYFLYAFSNAGSLCALVCYPFLVEPLMGVSSQSWLWMFGFFALVLTFAVCGWVLFSKSDLKRKQDVEASISSPEKLAWKKRLHFVVLAAVPSSLMLGVTTFIATDVGSMPLLWVIPLALYLLTFIFAFSRRTILPHSWITKALPYTALLMAVLLMVDLGKIPLLIAPLHLAAFFVVAMFCHGELARLRPPANQLTEFYFLLSIGGVVGGMFNGFVAPLIFTEITEYPLALIAACLLLPAGKTVLTWKVLPRELAWPAGVLAYLLVCTFALSSFQAENKLLAGGLLFGLPAILCFSFLEKRVRFAFTLAAIIFVCSYFFVDRNVVIAKRGFFGVNKVAIDKKNGYTLLINGRTVHGIQNLDDETKLEPLSYYHKTGPIGDVFRIVDPDRQSRVGVIGLGTGSIASYAKDGQHFDFFEIDPVVYEFASNPKYFNFLSESKGNCRVILGDARIQLQRHHFENHRVTQTVSHGDSEGVGQYRLLILDAFSSDSIPTHLVTREAFELYMSRLDDGGLMAVHITNKFIDLEPLLAGLCNDLGLELLIRYDGVAGGFLENGGKESSVYAIIAKRPEVLEPFAKTGNWDQPEANSDLRSWTDEYSNFLDVLRW